MDPIKALLFDKDGTLFDFQATWGAWAFGFFQDIAADADELAALHQELAYDPETQSFDPSSVAVAGTPGDIADVALPLLSRFTYDELIKVMTESSLQAPVAPVVPLDPLFRQLRRAGYHLGVATNDTEAAAHANLAQAQIQEHFAFVIGFDSGPTPKPAPDMVQAFADHLQLPAAQVAMIGDSTHDLFAGRAAGAATVGVLTGTALQQDLAPHADVVLPDIGHLPDWLACRSA